MNHSVLVTTLICCLQTHPFIAPKKVYAGLRALGFALMLANAQKQSDFPLMSVMTVEINWIWVGNGKTESEAGLKIPIQEKHLGSCWGGEHKSSWMGCLFFPDITTIWNSTILFLHPTSYISPKSMTLVTEYVIALFCWKNNKVVWKGQGRREVGEEREVQGGRWSPPVCFWTTITTQNFFQVYSHPHRSKSGLLNNTSEQGFVFLGSFYSEI